MGVTFHKKFPCVLRDLGGLFCHEEHEEHKDFMYLTFQCEVWNSHYNLILRLLKFNINKSLSQF